MHENPCLSCGACCAFFRVSFHWMEADPDCGGTVPPELTEPAGRHLVAMRGTNQPQPRCIALTGTIGEAVLCSIHPKRSSTCRQFSRSGESGLPNPDCDRARAAWGLAPLHPVAAEALVVPDASNDDHPDDHPDGDPRRPGTPDAA
ncbi:MAG: YkgJ family cysteine cluster protein [Halothiobacillaceae bacterium]